MQPREMTDLHQKQRTAFEQLPDTSRVSQREDRELLSALGKDTPNRTQPQLEEEHQICASFSRVLEEARANPLIRLRGAPKSSTYVIAEVLVEGS